MRVITHSHVDKEQLSVFLTTAGAFDKHSSTHGCSQRLGPLFDNHFFLHYSSFRKVCTGDLIMAGNAVRGRIATVTELIRCKVPAFPPQSAALASTC